MLYAATEHGIKLEFTFASKRIELKASLFHIQSIDDEKRAIPAVILWNGWSPYVRITKQKHIWFDFFVGSISAPATGFSARLSLIT